MLVAIEKKKTERVDFAKPLERYVKSTYDEQALSDHQQHINVLNTTREDVRAGHADRTEASRDLLMRYNTLLKSVELRFPISESNIRISFIWTDVLRGKRCTMFSIFFERANAMFNLAAAFSQLGASTPRNTADGPKAAAGCFQSAAGVFSAIAEYVTAHVELQAALPDLTPDVLKGFEDLMLANAQVCPPITSPVFSPSHLLDHANPQYCFYEKAMKSSVSKAVVSKLVAQAALWYESGARPFQAPAVRDSVPKAWMAHVEALADLTRAEAAMMAAEECDAAMKYGERVSRLVQAVGLIEEAKKRIK